MNKPENHEKPRRLDLRKDETLHVAQIGKSTMWALIAQGKFPAPHKLIPGAKHGPNCWNSDEVYAWVRERMGGD